MAKIEEFEQRPIGGSKVHDGVVCGYRWFDIGEQRILQLETYGRDSRRNPGKVSQSIQLDQDGARALKQLLERAFPGI